MAEKTNANAANASSVPNQGHPVAVRGPEDNPKVIIRGRTVPRRGQEPMLIADLMTAAGQRMEMVIFTDALSRMPDGVRLMATVPAMGGRVETVPVTVLPGMRSILGNGEIVTRGLDTKPVSKLLPELVRDAKSRRWLRPIPPRLE